MDASKPITKERMAEMIADARRADDAKRRYAEARGLDPITLKPPAA